MQELKLVNNTYKMEAKTIQKYRNKPIPSLRKTAKKWFHQFIRLRDCDDYGYATCISSGNSIKYGKQLQAGHYYPAGQNPAIEFNEDNVHSQSLQDNYFKHSNAIEYHKNLIKKIGLERVQKLDEIVGIAKRNGFKQDRFFLIEIIEKYKMKVQKMRTQKMFEV